MLSVDPVNVPPDCPSTPILKTFTPPSCVKLIVGTELSLLLPVSATRFKFASPVEIIFTLLLVNVVTPDTFKLSNSVCPSTSISHDISKLPNVPTPETLAPPVTLIPLATVRNFSFASQ